MERVEIRRQWEGAAPGWAKWEDTVATWIAPATEAMLDMAGVVPGAQVLDLASGAGSQTLSAARRVGAYGHVVANDISDTMLHYVCENARMAHLNHISTMAGAAEALDLIDASFDAVICRLGLMLFVEPANALAVVRGALKPGGKVAVVVFTQPSANAFMAKPMEILLRHAGKEPPAPGQPGIFSLGAPGVLERLLTESGFVKYQQRIFALPLRMPSAAQALAMMQEAFGAYRAVLSGSSETVQKAAWAEVAALLKSFETATGFEASAEVLVASGINPG